MDILNIVIAVITLIFGIFIGNYIKKSEIDRLSSERNELQRENRDLLKEMQTLTADKSKLDVLNQL